MHVGFHIWSALAVAVHGTVLEGQIQKLLMLVRFQISLLWGSAIDLLRLLPSEMVVV